MMPEFLLTNSAWCIDFVTEDEERNLAELFDREEGVEFGFRFGETLKVGAVNKEDNSIDFREVVAPETTSCLC